MSIPFKKDHQEGIRAISDATGRGPIREKGFLIDATAYQLQAFLCFYGIRLQLAGFLFAGGGFYS